jgi:hypothetical protein
VALLKAHKPTMDFLDVNTHLHDQANKENVVPTGMNCGNVDEVKN